MSIDDRMRSGLSAELAGIDPNVASMLASVQSGARRQRRRNVALAAAAAIVAIAGVLWGTGPLASLLGQQHVQPIDQPSERDDGSQGPRVEFTGDDCVYTGPTEFTVGDTIDITAVDMAEERNSVGYTLSKVVDGTTVAAAQELADAQHADPDGTADNSDNDAETYLQHQITEQGTERTLSHTLDVAGTWQLACFIAYEATFIATTFEVVE